MAIKPVEDLRKDIKGKSVSATPTPLLHTYILQFIYPKGNGWAFINATTISQAESVFYRQTKYEGTKITAIQETRWYGENMQLVYEGAVTTCTNLNVTISLSDLIANSDAYESVEEYLNHIFNFENYYTKDETKTVVTDTVKESLKDIELSDLDLSEYVKKTEIQQVVSNAVEDLDIHDGKDGKDGKDGATGPQGPQGVGITNITYMSTAASGGTNYLTISLSNGTSETYPILNGKDGRPGSQSQVEVESVEVLSLYRGDTQAAKTRAANASTTMFQYIWDTQDKQGNEFTKVIWYIGGGIFIDAVGTVVFTLDS